MSYLPLQYIFHNPFRTGVCLDTWKEANVTPFHKKENKQIANNYRPIFLLPICAEIFEKIFFKYLYNYLISDRCITNKQSGFRPDDSITKQLSDLVNEIFTSFDHMDTYETRAIFLDISKAFCEVWHDGLLFKLKQNGVEGNLH